MTTERKTDKKTIGLTARGRQVADDVLSRRCFKDKLDVAKFAMALAMQERSNPGYVEGADTTWNIGSFDPDGELKGLINVLYPNEQTPYRLVESFVEVGLDQLGMRIEQAGGVDIAQMMTLSNQGNTQFGKYDLLEELTSGGMAEAYIAKERDTGQMVFLKRVKLLSTDDFVAIQREGNIYTKLARSNLDGTLKVYEASQCDGYAYLVTECADGDLQRYVTSFPGKMLRSVETKAIGIDIITALHGLHSLNIVHRDLKPGNILRVNDHWKLGDFGIAKNLTRLVTLRTFQTAGTLGYAAPEQLDGVEAHSSADIYAFGKVLVFMLSGHTDVDVIRLPKWRDLILRCTDRKRESRPDALAVLADLQAILV